MIAADLEHGCAVERVLPYRIGQLFELVADVERYPEFVPGWTAARIREGGRGVYRAEQTVGFGPVRLTFGTRTVLRRPHRIEVTSDDIRFVGFKLSWTFEPQLDGRCRVRLAAVVRFRSWLLQLAADRALGAMAERTLAAFEARAGKLYGSIVEA